MFAVSLLDSVVVFRNGLLALLALPLRVAGMYDGPVVDAPSCSVPGKGQLAG